MRTLPLIAAHQADQIDLVLGLGHRHEIDHRDGSRRRSRNGFRECRSRRDTAAIACRPGSTGAISQRPCLGSPSSAANTDSHRTAAGTASRSTRRATPARPCGVADNPVILDRCADRSLLFGHEASCQRRVRRRITHMRRQSFTIDATAPVEKKLGHERRKRTARCTKALVGWAERSEAHHFPSIGRMMGFAALSPSYELRTRGKNRAGCTKRRQGQSPASSLFRYCFLPRTVVPGGYWRTSLNSGRAMLPVRFAYGAIVRKSPQRVTRFFASAGFFLLAPLLD